MRPQTRGYYIKYNQNTGLNGISDAAWGGIGSAVQGVAALGASIAQAFTIKKQCETQLKIARENNDTQKYIVDKQEKMQGEQLAFQEKMQQKAEDLATKEQMIAILTAGNQLLEFSADVIIQTCRNRIMPNIRYIFKKHGIALSPLNGLKEKITDLQLLLKSYYDNNAIETDINKLTTTMKLENTIGSATTIFYRNYNPYVNKIHYVKKILQVILESEDNDILYFLMSLYLFERYNYFFTRLSSQFNTGELLTNLILNEGVDDNLILLQEKNYYADLFSNKGFENEVFSYSVFQPTGLGAINYNPSYQTGGVNINKGSYVTKTFKFSDYGYDINKLPSEEAVQAIYNFLNSKGSSLFKETATYLEYIKKKSENLSNLEKLKNADCLQLFFNDIKIEIEHSGMFIQLKEAMTSYYDYEKQTQFIPEEEFDLIMPQVMLAEFKVIKDIFENIYEAMRESVQIRFLQELFGSVETLTYNNQEYLLGLMLSFILSGKAPYIDKNIIELIKQKLKEVDSSMQGEVKNIILQNLYMEYNMNEMMKKDINFAQEYDKNTLQGTYKISEKNKLEFNKKAEDIGVRADPFAMLDILHGGETSLTEEFMEYLQTEQVGYFITGIEALTIAQFLASRKQANMPEVVVSNLVIEIPLLKQLNQKYRFTRLSFFMFLQELYNQICGIAKVNTLRIAEIIVRGETKVQTLTNKEEEAQAQEVFDYFKNGQISFKKIIHPEFVMDNNVAMVALQLGDTITEGADIITTNAYLRVIFLIKENFAEYINEFEFDSLYVVTLANDKRVGQLRDANEEAYAVQYAKIANENEDYLKALTEYIWVKDALVTITEKPITLSVYNRTMTILKEQYGKQITEPIINPDSRAQKTNEMLTTEEVQKKNTNKALGWGTAALVLWKIFG